MFHEPKIQTDKTIPVWKERKENTRTAGKKTKSKRQEKRSFAYSSHVESVARFYGVSLFVLTLCDYNKSFRRFFFFISLHTRHFCSISLHCNLFVIISRVQKSKSNGYFEDIFFHFLFFLLEFSYKNVIFKKKYNVLLYNVN
jgi:hypothetical protein